MNPGRVAVLVLGILLLVANAGSVIKVLIVPRSASGLATRPMRMVRAVFRRVALLARTYTTMDRILATSEPVALLVLLATWLTVAIVGFTLVNWAIGDATLNAAFAEAGSSVFTLGFTLGPQLRLPRGRLHRRRHRPGAGGPPDRLPAHPLQRLQPPRDAGHPAGEPGRGPGLGARAAHPAPAGGPHRQPPSLFGDWERWAADVAESHTSYPSLLYLRSPRAKNSWVVSLIAVMDAAALTLAIDPKGAPIEARMCVRMGFTCLRDIAQVTGIPFDPDPDPDQPIALPGRSSTAACAHLREIGYPTSRPFEEAWPQFRGWRVNYEDVAYALASALNAPPARWTGPRQIFRAESLEPDRPIDRRPDHGRQSDTQVTTGPPGAAPGPVSGGSTG